MLKKPSALEAKVETLYQLGLTDREAVENYLELHTSGEEGNASYEYKLDRLARSMLIKYFDGDTQFVNLNAKEEGWYTAELKRRKA